MKNLLRKLLTISFFLYCSLSLSENNNYEDSQYFNSNIEIKFNGVFDVPPYGNIEAFDCNTVPVEIFIAIKNINKQKKVTIFLVEQNAKKALELADRGYVLVNGNVTLEGTGQDLLKNKDIQAAYLEGGGKK